MPTSFARRIRLTLRFRNWLMCLAGIGLSFTVQSVGTQTVKQETSCPYDQDIVIVLARDQVNLIAPDGKTSTDPKFRTWEAYTANKPHRVRMQFGPQVPEEALPRISDDLKGKRMVLFFDCAANPQKRTQQAFWSYEETLREINPDGYSFKLGEMDLAIMGDPDMVTRLGKYVGKRVRIGLMCPRHKLSKRLFNDGAIPTVILFPASNPR